MRHALLLAVFLTACTDFESLDRGVCGNGLIEEGEDCDSSDPSCVRCAVTCDEAADCPTGAYACGTDGLCHAPGGTLAPPVSAGPFQVNDYRITDIGGDGTGDVVGSSRTSIVIKPGDPSGLLGKGTSIVTPFQTGRTAFGDLDGDGSLDLTMTTPDGLVSYTSPLGELTPLPVQSSLGGAGNGNFELAGLYRVSNYALGAWLASTQNDTLLLSVFDLGDAMRDETVLPCNQQFRASKLTEQSYEVYRLSADDSPSTEVVLAITGELTSGSTRTCVVAITKTQTSKATITDITPLGAQTGLVGKPVLADLDFDADTCPSLLAISTQGLIRNFDGARAGGCTLPATSNTFNPPNVTPGAVLVGRLPLTPGIALVANDLLVLSDGVYAATVLGPTKVYVSPRKIARAEFGDINGDGRVDGIVASEGEDDIDVLLRTQDPGYQLVRLDTASRITSLTIGDYDGNGIEDIAYTELIDEYQRLAVSFSTADRPLEPISVGAFPNNISIVRLQVPDSLDPQGLAADLAVLTLKTGMRPPTVTVLHGSSQRTLLPYFNPMPSPAAAILQKAHQFRGAVVGRFAGGDELADIAAIGVPVQGHPDNNASTPIKAWVMRGTTVGPDGTVTPGKPITGVIDCTRTIAPSGLCVDDAFFLAWHSTDRDVVLMFARNGVGLVDPASVNAALPLTTAPGKLNDHAGLGFRNAVAADLDGDDREDVIAVFSKPEVPQWKVLACKNTGAGALDCYDHEPGLRAIPGVERCVDAAPGKIRYEDPFSPESVGSDLIVLCRSGPSSSLLIRVSTEGDGYKYEELMRVPEVLESLRVGDVTGDGLDDIAVLSNDHGAETLEVMRQCSSRDANVCRGGGQ